MPNIASVDGSGTGEATPKVFARYSAPLLRPQEVEQVIERPPLEEQQ